MKNLFLFFLLLAVSSQCFGCGKKGDNKEMNTPKKYFTMSFDDGTYEDEKMISLLKKYNVSASFCINTGLMDGNDVIEVMGKWRRMSLEYAKEKGVYDGFDVISHGYYHRDMILQSADDVISETNDDCAKIKELTGKKTVGFAYPGGTAHYDDSVIYALLDGTDVRFARDTDDTYGFSLPANFMAWKPTCSLLDNRLMQVAKEFVESEATEDMLFYVWDHPWAITANNKWEAVENFLKYVSGREDVVYVSNTEFYNLFKDKIPSKGVVY